MKKVLLSAAMLIGIFVSTPSAFSQCLTQWQYATPVTITNPTASNLYNFQVKLYVNTAALVSAGKLQASGNDLRFYMGDCCNVLPYVIDSAMNTSSTVVWVKVPSIAASSATTINMAYGNPGATSVSDPATTFDLWEPFDSPTNHFAMDACGTGTYSVSGGTAALGWSANMIVVSDLTFDMDTIYTAETNVTASSGNWPGMHWLNETGGNLGYGILYGGGQVRNSKTGTSSGFCQGHNWSSGLFNYSTAVGIWSTTWMATGSQESYVPGLYIPSTDNEHGRTDNLKLVLGGISNGSGMMTLDWVRVRKYSSTTPSSSYGTEIPLSFASISAGPDTGYCAGSTVQLSATAGFTSYSWNTGATTSAITVNAPGTYIITGVDASSCSSKDTVVVTELMAPSVNLGNDISACANDSTSLNAGAGSASYSWSNGATTQNVDVLPGTYSVVVEGANGCFNSDTITIGSYPLATAGYTTSVTGLSVNFTNTSGGGTSYLWNFGDGDTSTQASPTHVYPAPGTYQACLTVTTSNGCESAICTSLTVTNTGLENTFANAGIQLYPNPATNVAWLTLPQNLVGADLSIVDLLGKSVYTATASSGNVITLPTSAMARGVYTIRVTWNAQTYTGKLILN